MQIKRSTSAMVSFAGVGRDKVHQQIAWRTVLQSQRPTISTQEVKRRIADAKKRLKNEPIGCAIRLAPGCFLKKKGKNVYDISSLQ